jgi:hypothetical protein
MEGIIMKLIVKNHRQGDGENGGKAAGNNPREKVTK